MFIALRPKSSGAVRTGGTQLEKFTDLFFRPAEPRVTFPVPNL